MRKCGKGVIYLTRITVVKEDIAEKFRLFMENGRIMLFRAPCGFGKTTLAKTLLKNCRAKVYETTEDKMDFTAIRTDKKWNVLLADDLQLLCNREEQQELCEIIRNSPEKRFVFMTRGMIPGWLIPFQLSGLLYDVEAEEMFFDRKTAEKFFEGCGLKLSETVFNAIMQDSMGYPLALTIIAGRMEKGAEYDGKLSGEVIHEIYLYYDEMIFRRFELPIRRFLLELAPFEEFSTELAKMVSGDINAGRLLSQLQKDTSMMIFDGPDEFHFWHIFRNFLLWEQDREYTKEQQRSLYSRGGLYYELHENYGKALEYYSKSGEKEKVSELLIKATRYHPGMGHYEEMESYYSSLPDTLIKESPSLMQAKSMLCALHADYDGSERWYRELEEFAAVRKKSDAAAKEARSRLTWLNIALPQRGVTGLADTIKTAFRLITDKEMSLPSFSVTSTLPSIMNGGKDFSDWSKIDDFLYSTIRIPVTAILGRDGTALPECAIAESKFEKGEDVSSRMLTLVSKISEVQNKGTPDIEFALVGLLVRNQIDTGRAEDAINTLTAMKERFAERGLERFMPNINAMLCRIALRRSDMAHAEEWYRSEAPKDVLNMRTLKRYLYFTKAMTELASGNEEAALLTLSPLEPYCIRCDRHIDTIHLKLLYAIAKQRRNDNTWKEDISMAMSIAEEYGFVRTVSTYGAVILPLLEESKNGKFAQKVIKAARNQAVYYPDFLKPKKYLSEKLTDAEIQVLRLLCADKSNSEIGEILNIRLATVKSHVSHILQKLGVSRRSEAKTTAERLNII